MIQKSIIEAKSSITYRSYGIYNEVIGFYRDCVDRTEVI